MRYRNVRHGREVVRPTTDEWLEASAGWERVDDAPTNTETPDTGMDDERTDDGWQG